MPFALRASLSCSFDLSLFAVADTFSYDCRFVLTASGSCALDPSLYALGGTLNYDCRFALTASLLRIRPIATRLRWHVQTWMPFCIDSQLVLCIDLARAAVTGILALTAVVP